MVIIFNFGACFVKTNRPSSICICYILIDLCRASFVRTSTHMPHKSTPLFSELFTPWLTLSKYILVLVSELASKRLGGRRPIPSKQESAPHTDEPRDLKKRNKPGLF